MATDGQGNWLAVWDGGIGASGLRGTDRDILVARSTDNGETWTVPAPLNADAAGDPREDTSPRIATDGQGNWVAVWQSGTLSASEYEVRIALSADNGRTWTKPAPLTSSSTTKSRYAMFRSIASAGQGYWVSVWQEAALERGLEGPQIGNGRDIFVAEFGLRSNLSP